MDSTLEPSFDDSRHSNRHPSPQRRPASHKPSRSKSHHNLESGNDYIPGRRRPKASPPSVVTVESLSTIASMDGHMPADVKDIYKELQEINDKLKREFKVLHQRDLVLKQKEKSLTDLQLSLDTAIDNEVKRRLADKRQDIQDEFHKVDAVLREKTRENKRLKENFDALKNANDILRKELDLLMQSHEKLEKQHSSVQARLINLQRKKDHDEKKEGLVDMFPNDLTSRVKQGIVTAREQKVVVKKSKTNNTTNEVIASLLDWVSDSQLRQAAVDQPTKLVDGVSSQEILEDRCFKMLPPVVELLRDQAVPGGRIVLPSLQFIYWALLHLEASQSQHQRTSLSSTLRRLGEDLYRGRSNASRTVDRNSTDSTCEMSLAPSSETSDKHKDLFYKSPHLHTRFLSCIIILKTITQVDYLAHVYETLRNDLKSDSGKEFFLYYQTTPVMLGHFKPCHKALISCALDIYLQMAMDSVYLRTFLDSCSQEKWFQSVSLLWRMQTIEPKQQEKISILLQKLSKIKNNKKYFEVFGLTTSCQELQRTAAGQSPFLSLNLKSILFNLNGAKTQLKPAS